MVELNVLGQRLRSLRDDMKNENSKFTQSFIANLIGVARTTYTAYENGTKQPPMETVNKIADVFGVTTDYLYGRTDSKHPEFSSNEKKDIAKQMEKIRKDLESQDGLSFYGEPLSEEALESLMESMEYVVKQTKKINRKYIPKKYRDK